MKLSHSFFVASYLLGSSFALGSIFVCGTPEPTAEFIQLMPDTRRDNLARQIENITVPVYFHIASTVANENMVSDQQVADQFQVLQDTYALYNIQLNLISTDRIVDDLAGTGYYYPNGTFGDDRFAQFLLYLRETRLGGYDSLNVYFYTDFPSGIQGSCNLPTVVEPDSDFFYRDGCMINANTMPGSPAPNNLGHTTIHEVGHWFGLLHTFQGGCSIYGDGVLDTPPQRSASSGCPVNQDTCPDLEGLDPVTNYMDYSNDECTTEFTPGQTERMHTYYSGWRAGL